MIAYALSKTGELTLAEPDQALPVSTSKASSPTSHRTIAAVFLLGVFSKRVTATAAITGMVGGFLVGMLRLVAEINKDSLDGALLAFASINFLHFAALLFVFCVVLMVVVSRFTEPPSEEKLRGLTYETTGEAEAARSRATWSKLDVTLTMVLVAMVAGVMLYFRG